MSVENFKVIDFASVDKNGNTVLTISDHLKWDSNNEHLLVLQNKINAYLSFIEDGSIYKEYPNSKGRNIIIKIIANFDPNEKAIFFLNECKEILNTAGYGFDFTVLNKNL